MQEETVTTNQDASPIQERISRFERFVRNGLEVARKAVYASDPDDTRLTVSIYKDGSFGMTTFQERQEIVRRIQAMSPNWIVSISPLGSDEIVIDRKMTAGAIQDLAYAFSVSDVQQQALVDAGPAIAAAVETVQAHITAFGRNEDEFEVPFPTNTPSFYVLKEAARRIQYYSADWKVEANKANGSISFKRPPAFGGPTDNT